jgi:hypothetical protein
MFINVNLTTRRAEPWNASILTGLKIACDIHASIPRPAKLGRHIGIRRGGVS